MTAREMVITVPAGKSRERLDLFLTHHVENATRSKVQAAIRQGYVLVDGKPVKSSHIVTPGEVIAVTIPKPPPPDVLPEQIPLDILYEDHHVIVVNKPAGMVTHPAYTHYSGTLVNALLHHCGGTLSTVNDRIRPGIVHRLDKDTSGLIIVAKDDRSHALLARQFSERTIEREYWAVVWGTFGKRRGERESSGVIEASLGRSVSDRKKVAVRDDGKPAVTTYDVLEEFAFLTLLKLKLRTGRTHQIRVHLHHIGHPVFGDPTYGGRRIAWGGTDRRVKAEVQALLSLIDRQALHAKTLGFVHPVTGTMLRFDSPLPADMDQLLQALRASR